MFKAVIQQSGTVLNPWAITYNPREQAFMLGEALGIKTTDSEELVKKLSEFDVKDIIAASGEIMKKQVRNSAFFFLIFCIGQSNFSYLFFMKNEEIIIVIFI